MMDSKQVLEKVKASGIFTAGLTFEKFISDLCKRYSRVYGEILPIHDYDYIVKKLVEKGILEPENDLYEPFDKEPLYL